VTNDPTCGHADEAWMKIWVVEDFLDGHKSAAEKVLAKLLETCMGKEGVKVYTTQKLTQQLQR
jgi:hypothetical protein